MSRYWSAERTKSGKLTLKLTSLYHSCAWVSRGTKHGFHITVVHTYIRIYRPFHSEQNAIEAKNSDYTKQKEHFVVHT